MAALTHYFAEKFINIVIVRNFVFRLRFLNVCKLFRIDIYTFFNIKHGRFFCFDANISDSKQNKNYFRTYVRIKRVETKKESFLSRHVTSLIIKPNKQTCVVTIRSAFSFRYRETVFFTFLYSILLHEGIF